MLASQERLLLARIIPDHDTVSDPPAVFGPPADWFPQEAHRLVGARPSARHTADVALFLGERERCHTFPFCSSQTSRAFFARVMASWSLLTRHRGQERYMSVLLLAMSTYRARDLMRFAPVWGQKAMASGRSRTSVMSMVSVGWSMSVPLFSGVAVLSDSSMVSVQRFREGPVCARTREPPSPWDTPTGRGRDIWL